MTNENSQKSKIPAIGLIVVGVLNILTGLYFLLSGIIVAYSGVVYKNFNTEQDKFAFQIGFYGVIILGILSLAVAPVIIYGALKIMRGASGGAAKLSPILAMIPLISFPGFLLGIPFGVWALFSMKKSRAEI